jgi:hypothetical protein
MITSPRGDRMKNWLIILLLLLVWVGAALLHPPLTYASTPQQQQPRWCGCMRAPRPPRHALRESVCCAALLQRLSDVWGLMIGPAGVAAVPSVERALACRSRRRDLRGRKREKERACSGASSGLL